jgi:hypothetical protein
LLQVDEKMTMIMVMVMIRVREHLFTQQIPKKSQAKPANRSVASQNSY